MRRWVAMALVVGAVILTVEGYFVYRFYTDPDTAEVRSPGPTVRETEPGPAATTRPEIAERPAAEAAAEAPARVPVEAPAEVEPEARPEAEATRQARPGTGPCTEGEDGCVGEADEARYAREIGQVQDRAVAVFLDSHEKMRRYDGLTAEDVDVMRENRSTLEGLSGRVGELEPPREHEDQHGVIASAIADLAEATAIAHGLAADPVSATSSRIERYDRLVDEAAIGLQRSNEMLGSDHETVADVQDIGA